VNRRSFVLMVSVIVLVEVARTGLVKLWAHKAYLTTTPDSLSHKVADVAVCLT
jgi:hypothetical protein